MATLVGNIKGSSGVTGATGAAGAAGPTGPSGATGPAPPGGLTDQSLIKNTNADGDTRWEWVHEFQTITSGLDWNTITTEGTYEISGGGGLFGGVAQQNQAWWNTSGNIPGILEVVNTRRTGTAGRIMQKFTRSPGAVIAGAMANGDAVFRQWDPTQAMWSPWQPTVGMNVYAFGTISGGTLGTSAQTLFNLNNVCLFAGRLYKVSWHIRAFVSGASDWNNYLRITQFWNNSFVSANWTIDSYYKAGTMYGTANGQSLLTLPNGDAPFTQMSIFGRSGNSNGIQIWCESGGHMLVEDIGVDRQYYV